MRERRATFAAPAAVLALILAVPVRADLGAVDGKLADCPSSPNCVSSQASDEDRRVDPLAFQGSAPDALARLAEVIRGMPRTQVLVEGNGYLRAEFTTEVFGWVDDVEALADPVAKVIHVRSASRAGYWDLGTNRDRIAEIRALYAQQETDIVTERKPLLLTAGSAVLAAVLCAFPPAGLAQGQEPGTDTDEGSPVPDPTREPGDDESGGPT